MTGRYPGFCKTKGNDPSIAWIDGAHQVGAHYGGLWFSGWQMGWFWWILENGMSLDVQDNIAS